jgi:methylisocitrate lyase
LEGLESTINRVKALVDAGADAVFPEALIELREFEAVRAAVQVPVLANMTEFGKSELFTTSQLADVGVNIVIYPVSLLRLSMGVASRALDALTEQGSFSSMLAEMQHREDLYELLDYRSYSKYDSTIFNFHD